MEIKVNTKKKSTNSRKGWEREHNENVICEKTFKE